MLVLVLKPTDLFLPIDCARLIKQCSKLNVENDSKLSFFFVHLQTKIFYELHEML